MKPSYVFLITLAAGLAGGYLAAPQLLPALTKAIYGPQSPAVAADEGTAKPGSTATPDKPEVADTDKGNGVAPGEDFDWSEDPDDGLDRFADAQDPDAFQDGKEEDFIEDDDPEGENVQPERIAKYRRKGAGQGEDDGMQPVREPAHQGKISPAVWKQPKILKRRLAGRLRSRLKGVDQASVEKFLEDPEVRLMLAQWELLNRCNLDDLAKLMKDRKACESLAVLLNDLQWITGFVYDAELQNAEVALSMLAHFRQVDPRMDEEILVDGGDRPAVAGLKRRVAGAIAVQFTRNGWYGEEKELSKEELDSFKDLGYIMPSLPSSGKRKSKSDIYRAARERYLYFAESIDQDRLNGYFAELPTWLLQYCCGWKGNSPFGTASTMRWLRDNCAAPARAYTGMAFQVPYLPTNVYGDSIFSQWYYQPFDVLYPGNFAKETRDVGAVCGGLSHFGTSAACANGVPAITMGEPGHCAYAVYFDGKWHGANSLSEDRHPHWNTWGETTWSALQMQTAMYQQGAITRDAQMVCTLATMLGEHNNPINALKLFELSVQMQPLYRPVWDFYMETAARSLGKRPRKWLGVNEFVCTSITPEHPEMCCKFLMERIYPSMLKTLRSPKQKLAAFEAYFKNINVNEKAQWDFQTMFDLQYSSLGKARTYKEQFMQILVDNVALHPEFCQMIAWAVKTAHAEGKPFAKKIMAMITKAIEEHPEAKDLLSCGVIRGAEECGDIELANLWSQDYLDSNRKMPTFEPVGGNLVSAGGLVTLSKYNDDQSSIIHHAAALTEKGGHIYSAFGKHQTVTVELPKKSRIGGIVIIPTNGCGSYRTWKIEISADGNTWKTLTELPDGSKEPCIRICIKRSHPTAKFIRIDSGEDQLVGINFKAILVYDNKKVK